MPRAYGVAALMLLAAPPARAQVAVLTQRYDNQRTGLNLAETTLTQANVSPQTFGKVFSLPVDGQLYAQPLIVPQVVIPDAGTHDLVILATEHDSVYAYDAEDVNQTHALWQVNFGMSVPNAEVACNDLTPAQAFVVHSGDDTWPMGNGVTAIPLVPLMQRLAE